MYAHTCCALACVYTCVLLFIVLMVVGLSQVLTHVREKLRFIEKSNKVLHTEVDGIEERSLHLRAQLAVLKKDRDAAKDDNKELRRQQGFATSDLLLIDFETRKASLEGIRAEIRELQDRYEVLARAAGVSTGFGASRSGSKGPVAIANPDASRTKLPVLTLTNRK